MLGFDGPRSRPGRRDVNEAGHGFGPGPEAPHAVWRADHAVADSRQLLRFADRSVEKEAVTGIDETLAVAELQQRFLKIQSTRFEGRWPRRTRKGVVSGKRG